VLGGHVAITNGWAIIGVTGSVAAGFDKVIIRGVNAHSHAGGYVYIDCVLVVPSKTFIWGDTDCSGDVNAVDALEQLRYVAHLEVSQAEGCPPIGSTVFIGGVGEIWGDCTGDPTMVDAVDALTTLRQVAMLPVTLPETCPAPPQGIIICLHSVTTPGGITISGDCFELCTLEPDEACLELLPEE